MTGQAGDPRIVPTQLAAMAAGVLPYQTLRNVMRLALSSSRILPAWSSPSRRP